ncbi:MAG: hypothetical protein ACYC9Z_10245 [Casimicrobiaceae bacterium]
MTSSTRIELLYPASALPAQKISFYDRGGPAVRRRESRLVPR